MELEKYISSGILERYVLGDTTPEENKELEGYVKLYPELKSELEVLQDAIEAYAKAHAIQPPAALKDKVMQAIEEFEEGTYEPPATLRVEHKQEEEETKKETKVIPMRKPDYFRWVAAAAIALLVASGAYNFKQYNDLKAAENRLASLEAQNDVLAEESQTFRARLEENDRLMAAISNPDNVIVSMAGLPEKAPGALANIYYNKTTQEAYMTIGSLPTPPADKQYQLWGVELGPNGELRPTSMGVFDVEGGIIKMENMPGNPALFAVTLEPKGGSESPTLEEMYAMGQI